MTFDRQPGAKPLYLQLYERLRETIIEKDLSAGQKLPSKKRLASHLGVSVKTVENAYFQLALEGYIQSKEKVGYFVSDIEGFMAKDTSKMPAYEGRYREDSWRLDIKANKTPPEMFPLSVWARLGREVFAEQGRNLLETVPFNGVAELRVAIAGYLHDFRGMTVSPDQIIVGSGTEYLYQRLTHLLGPGCVIGMDDPGYSHIKKILANDGVPYHCIPMDEAGMDPELLRLTDCTAIHLSPMHHFPLGMTIPVQRRVELLKWANAAHDRYIIEDDYNSEFLYQGSPVQTIYGLDIRQKVIYMNTFSKTVAPSLRVAFMVLPEQLMDKYLDTMSFYSCTVSSSLQYQLAKFISEGHLERYIHRVRQHNLGQRKLVLETIEGSPIKDRIEVVRLLAGTHFLCRLDTKRSDKDLCQALRERGILASFVSEYCERPLTDMAGLLILNYSRIDADGMRYLLEVLERTL